MPQMCLLCVFEGKERPVSCLGVSKEGKSRTWQGREDGGAEGPVAYQPILKSPPFVLGEMGNHWTGWGRK